LFDIGGSLFDGLARVANDFRRAVLQVIEQRTYSVIQSLDGIDYSLNLATKTARRDSGEATPEIITTARVCNCAKGKRTNENPGSQVESTHLLSPANW
jgi:hypothetical protein